MLNLDRQRIRSIILLLVLETGGLEIKCAMSQQNLHYIKSLVLRAIYLNFLIVHLEIRLSCVLRI